MEIDSHSTSEQEQLEQQQRELFVVQRCWHSGPNEYQPLDLMRLFVSQRDAEEAAYHSAHAWCRYHRPDAEPQVKTLLLPRYPSHSCGGSSYGFIAHGSLFWVRSLYAKTTAPTTTDMTTTATEAYAVVTEGVIGGTGNRGSRRGTEVPIGRVFLPESGTHTLLMKMPVNSYASREVMRRKALETCHQLLAMSASHHHHISINVSTLPVGRPSEYSSGNFLKEWPPQVLQPNLLLDTDSSTNYHKRQNAAAAAAAAPKCIPFGGSCSLRTVSAYDDEEGENENDIGIVVDCPFEVPAAKRRRFCDDSSFHSSFQPINNNIIPFNDDVMMS